MKTKELESKVAAVRQIYQIERGSEFTKIKCLFPYGDGVLYSISTSIVGSYLQGSDALDIPEHDRLALQKLAYKYSRTPLDEREDEPKFRVRMMPNLPNQNSSLYYVNYSLKNSEIDVGPDVDMSEDPLFRSKCHFTKKEYVSIQREFPDWLPKFDKDDPHFEIVEEDK